MGRYTIPDDINQFVLGRCPGETFNADIPPAQEARLLARGQILLAESLDNKTRPELDTLARELGVDDPEELPNKDAVIAAINNKQKGA